MRNGDVWTDGRGPVDEIVDRSLNAHVLLARNMSNLLDINNMFLATDNVTLTTLAPAIYPEYKWYMLRRKIVVYEKPGTHIHESSPQIELGNILADIITAGRCSALVSAFDSSFTRSVHSFFY